MAALVFAGQSYPLVRKLTSIGADPDADIVIHQAGVAEGHAHVRLEGDAYVLVPLDPRDAPVLVNGRAVKRHTLEHGDEIRLGPATLRFQLWADTSTASRMTSPRAASQASESLTAYRRLAAFSTKLAHGVDVGALLEALLDEVVELTGADKGFIVLARADGPRVASARNVQRETIQSALGEVAGQLSDSILQRVISTRQPVIVSDALHDAQFNASLSVMRLRLCSVMCVPLQFRGELLGLIYVGNDNVVSLFDDQALETLSVFASQAALLLHAAQQVDALKQDNTALREVIAEQKFGDLIGACDAMREVFRKLDRVATTDISVLLLGETGTGKELLARELHRRSPRHAGPFVALNCGALPESLMESELFGHRRGAFTGAVADKIGCFQAAHGGTLFLDEIGEMPATLQVKLLRALQERVITPVGDTKPIAVDLRVVAATHVDLEQAIKAGRFREDLYYRLNVMSLELPPLRRRDEDVVLIARFLLDKCARDLDRSVRGFTRDAVIALRKHLWPGNIRELENRIKKGVLLADGVELTPNDLDLDDAQLVGRVLPLAEAREAWQRRYIDEVLALNGGNRTKAARDLGVDPRTIFRHVAQGRDEE